MIGRRRILRAKKLRNCSVILRRRTATSRSGLFTKEVYPIARLPRNGTSISVRNSGHRAKMQSPSPEQWSNWIGFSPFFRTIICRFPGSHSSASGSSTISVVAKEWPKHALSWARLWRSCRHANPRNQLRNELVGHAFKRRERSILLPAEGCLLQRRWTYVGKASPSQRDLSRTNSLQREERI